MDFRFSDEQQQLRDTIERFVRRDYGFEKRREIIRSEQGWSREVWRQFADMGLLAVGIPEEQGGLGGDAFDTLLVMEALGAGLVVEPYLSTVVLGAGLIARAGSAEQQAEVLPAVVAGERLLALAHEEPQSRYRLSNVSTSAQRKGEGWVLNGQKTVVLHGDSADQLIVSARTAGNPGSAQGISLFLVDARAAGVIRQGYPTQDGQRAAEIWFENVELPAAALIGSEHEGLPVLERTVERGIAALCAEAVGNMGAVIEATVGYLKTRKQFGVPIGSFQALQHRAADMYVHAEQARSMSYLAAARVGSEDEGERRRAIAGAKLLVNQSARFVGQQAVQLHGGIGVTDELAVSHYFKRLTMIGQQLGDSDHHLAAFSAAMAA